MSNWTHNICLDCWLDREPEQYPTRLINRPLETCCYCGLKNRHGIFVRDNPKDKRLLCKGKHREEK
jgi:hypothetical protein